MGQQRIKLRKGEIFFEETALPLRTKMSKYRTPPQLNQNFI